MAITTQNSTEYANTVATPPVMNQPTEDHGRMRIQYFKHTQSGAGDAGSSVALCKLPGGKVRMILALSRAYVNWTTSSANLDLGWDAYTDATEGSEGDTVAADPDGLVDNLGVDTVGYFNFEGGLATTKALGGTYVFESQDGVVIRATSQAAAMADGDVIAGYIIYVID